MISIKAHGFAEICSATELSNKLHISYTYTYAYDCICICAIFSFHLVAQKILVCLISCGTLLLLAGISYYAIYSIHSVNGLLDPFWILFGSFLDPFGFFVFAWSSSLLLWTFQTLEGSEFGPFLPAGTVSAGSGGSETQVQDLTGFDMSHPFNLL